MIKKIIVISIISLSAFACDCSGQVAYAFANQIRLLKKAYAPLKTETDNMTKAIKKMTNEKKAENKRFEKLITVETHEALTIANIAFLMKKKNNLPFITSMPLNLKIDLYKLKKEKN